MPVQERQRDPRDRRSDFANLVCSQKMRKTCKAKKVMKRRVATLYGGREAFARNGISAAGGQNCVFCFVFER